MAFASVINKRQWPFSPQCLSTCVVWFDAEDTSSYSINPFSWRNKCHRGNSSNITNTPSGIITKSMINNIPAITFGHDAHITAPSITYTQNSRTVFCVVSSIANNTIFLNDNNSIGTRFNITNNELLFITDSTTVLQSMMDNTLNLSPPSICCASMISSDISSGIYINGAYIDSTKGNEIIFPAGETTTQLIGSYGSFTIGEILIFDGALSIVQRQQVEGYLAAKWRIAVPSIHPYYSVAVLNTIFQPNDITGCSLWLDSGDMSTITLTNGDNVNLWKDKSGKGNNATPSANNPTYPYPESSGISFSSKLQQYFNISVPYSQSHSIFMVVQTHTTDLSAAFLSILNGYTGTSILSKQGTIFADNGTSVKCNLSDTAGAITLIDVIRSEGKTMVGYGYPSGTIISPQSVALNTITDNASSWDFIGHDDSNYFISPDTRYLAGTIYEVIIYNNALTNSQRLQVETYLAQKWGIKNNLGTSHPGYYLPAYTAL